MAGLAFRFAMASPKVQAWAVEAPSFPDRSRRYGVRAVPTTVVNADVQVVGAVPEGMLRDAIAKALTNS